MDDHESSASERESALSGASEARTSQLHEARAALAEAVSTLRRELDQRHAEMTTLRQEVKALRDERDRAVKDNGDLRAALEVHRQAVEETSHALSEFQNMKVVRWSRPIRSLVYRLRGRNQ